MITRIDKVWFDNEYIFVKLNNEQTISKPIRGFKNLSKGSVSQLEHYKIVNNGSALRWDELDEDLSLDGFLE
jgi:hypothetical protein